ncbi:MAG TPA: Hsp20/alpha crystallin family protein, partial [Candidatus Limnocylindrales bacterium]|nr:Hsp20/alpha crystallin family protein [Candidatus Limnocylindrales bacterium]
TTDGSGRTHADEHGGRILRYRRLSYRYAMVMRTGQAWPFGDLGQADRLRLLVHTRWRPDADMIETASAVEITVELSGVSEDDFEVQLFEDALVVTGQRRIPSSEEAAVYHTASIRQGPFQVELPLPAAVDAERVKVQYDRGLLRVTLPKRAEAR